MSSKDIALRVENLGKMYRMGREIPHASSIGGKIRQAAAAPFGWLASQMREPGEEEILWALKDVSFEVNRGEVVGLIGPNGAGKSTLLKILSRITEPTTGHAEIHGRIAALLEVGTGMHMELTGRENIYMNGTVLGMKKREIDHKFDEIVDFSGIERFLDTPVKRYSSGMRVRLGFSIAAHLEPEILVVDEVLAVGDLNFQKKCINKMEDVAGQGRTVLFVSHRMEAIRSLCGRCILINQGRLSTDGGVDEVVQQYYDAVRDRDITADLSASKENHRRGSGKARFSGCKVLNATGLESDHFEPGEDIVFQFDYKVFSPIDQLYIRIGLRSPRSGEFVTVTEPHLLSSKSLRPGEQGCRKLTFPSANLRLGDYPVYLWLGTADYEAYDVVDDLTQPLLIRSSKTTRELGYDVSKHSGFFDIQSVLDA